MDRGARRRMSPKRTDVTDGNGDALAKVPMLKRLHAAVYPKDSEYFWYRRGKVGASLLEFKYGKLILLMAAVALSGSGSVMFPIVLSLSLIMSEFASLWLGADNPSCIASSDPLETFQNVSNAALLAFESGDGSVAEYVELSIKNPLFISAWMIAGGLSTLCVYYLGASSLYNEYYVKRRHLAHEWKSQPTKFPDEALLRHERFWGCLNAFIAGSMGVGLYFLHHQVGLFHFRYDVGQEGFMIYLRDCLLVYLWVDFSAYWFHRMMHTKWLYAPVHKRHHFYKQPTPFSAFAMHPVEYMGFQLSGISCAFFFPMHIMSLLTVVSYVAFHNMVDHSGICLEGELPWTPSSQFHDDHHKLFHLNLGLTLVVWDWLFGTLRMKKRIYSEDRLVGQQEATSKKIE